LTDETVTIKNATNKQLDELLIRLRKENEVQNLIRDLKRKSTNQDYSYNYEQSVSTEEPIESLYHYGVPGMRWGVRRKRNSGGRIKGKRSQGSSDYQKTRKLKRRGTKNLSTQELKELTQRLQLEKQYKDLSPAQITRGLNVVKTITAAGTTVASLYALSKTPLAQDVIKAMAKKAG
jgi:hypothetical protein